MPSSSNTNSPVHEKHNLRPSTDATAGAIRTELKHQQGIGSTDELSTTSFTSTTDQGIPSFKFVAKFSHIF
jgi:hypothetical protein